MGDHTHDGYRGLNPVKRLSHCYCHKLTAGHKPGWFERLLILLIPHFDIVKTVPGEGVVVYLRRFYIFRSRWLGMNFGDVYLHHIVRSDDDPDPHDHPWGFRGFIIWGGYTDQQWKWNPANIAVETTTVSTMGGKLLVSKPQFVGTAAHRSGPVNEEVRPFTFISRKAEHIHRVIVVPGRTAWTLILTSAYGRDWNFITENGPVFWRTYLGIPPDVDVGE